MLDRSLINEPPTLNGDVMKALEEFPIQVRCERLHPHNYKLHVQPGIELNLTLEGQGTYVIDNHILRQSSGQLLIFPGKLPHQVFINTTYKRYVLLIDDKKLAAMLPDERIRIFVAAPYQKLNLRPETYLQVRQILAEMCEEFHERKTGWQEMLLSGVLRLAAMIQRSEARQEQEGKHADKRAQKEDVVSRICAYISEHLQEDLSLKSVANSFHINPDHLIRTFKKEKGMTFHKYVLLQRVIKSKRLLTCYPNKSLTEVAFDAGFTSSSQFSKTFKRFIGRTPSEYRENSMEMEAL